MLFRRQSVVGEVARDLTGERRAVFTKLAVMMQSDCGSQGDYIS